MEMDNEVKGTGNALNFGARIHDPRLGRFLSVDPIATSMPSFSTYGFAFDSPILFIDEGGLSGIPHYFTPQYFIWKDVGMTHQPNEAETRELLNSFLTKYAVGFGSAMVIGIGAGALASAPMVGGLGIEFSPTLVGLAKTSAISFTFSLTTQVATIQYVHYQKTGELASGTMVARQIDAIDLGLSGLPLGGWWGVVSNVLLPSAADYTLDKGFSSIADGTKSTGEFASELVINGILHGVASVLSSMLVKSGVKSTNSPEARSMAYQMYLKMSAGAPGVTPGTFEGFWDAFQNGSFDYSSASGTDEASRALWQEWVEFGMGLALGTLIEQDRDGNPVNVTPFPGRNGSGGTTMPADNTQTRASYRHYIDR